MPARQAALTALTILALGAPARAQDADIGAGLYLENCATCHGADAMGNGPFGAYMTVQSPDLTTLAANAEGGRFPMLDVIHIIDGRTEIGAHGGAMPVWGRIFSEEMEPRIGRIGAVMATRGRIMSLALYLESIQR